MMRVRNFRLWLLPVLTGATIFQLGGCDPTIRDTVFAGIQSATVGLVTTFINALFLVLQPDQQMASALQAVDTLIGTFC